VEQADYFLPIAAPGPKVVGLDISPEMLAIAPRQSRAVGTPLRASISIVEGNMRDFSLDMRFPN